MYGKKRPIHTVVPIKTYLMWGSFFKFTSLGKPMEKVDKTVTEKDLVRRAGLLTAHNWQN